GQAGEVRRDVGVLPDVLHRRVQQVGRDVADHRRGEALQVGADDAVIRECHGSALGEHGALRVGGVHHQALRHRVLLQVTADRLPVAGLEGHGPDTAVTAAVEIGTDGVGCEPDAAADGVTGGGGGGESLQVLVTGRILVHPVDHGLVVTG